jgi:hypothetical protein
VERQRLSMRGCGALTGLVGLLAWVWGVKGSPETCYRANVGVHESSSRTDFRSVYETRLPRNICLRNAS